MRVIFLSSPFFSYVHTFVLDADAYNISDTDAHSDTAPTQPTHPTSLASSVARPSPTVRGPLLARLAAWINQLTEEVVC